MSSAKMGSKHACPKCKARFYDLGRSPLVCPKCDTVIEVAAQGGATKKTTAWTPPVMRNAIHTKKALTAASLMDRADLTFVAADARSIPEVDDEAEDAEVGHLKDVEELSEHNDDDDADEGKIIEDMNNDSAVVLINAPEDEDAEDEGAARKRAE